MKNLISLILLLLPFSGIAQTAYYHYDKAGNCTTRTVIHYHSVPTEETILADQAAFRGNPTTAAVAQVGQPDVNPVVNEKGGHTFKIYPNPSQGYLRIEMEEKFLHLNQKSAAFYDLNGKLLARRQIEASFVDFNLTGYAAGSYILRIEAEGFQKEWQIIKH